MPVRTALARIAAAAALLLAFAAPAAAQTDTAAIARALRGVCPGREVRLAVAPADTVRGYCGYAEDGRLLVRWAQAERHVALAEVETVWVRRRGTRKGAATGALIGGVALGALGVFVGHGLCDGTRPCGGRMLFGGGGALLGALGGAAFGHVIGGRDRWQRRYPPRCLPAGRDVTHVSPAELDSAACSSMTRSGQERL